MRLASRVLALVIVLLAAACSTTPPDVPAVVDRTCGAPYPSGTPTTETVFCADPASLTTASVVKIVDGDTLDVIVEGVEERVRVFGVDTPERGDPCYREATERLRELAAGDVLLRRDARNRDPNGRLLRYVFTGDGVSIDAVLVAEGFALAWTRDGVARDALVALEARARANGTGCIWKVTSRRDAGTIAAGEWEI